MKVIVNTNLARLSGICIQGMLGDNMKIKCFFGYHDLTKPTNIRSKPTESRGLALWLPTTGYVHEYLYDCICKHCGVNVTHWETVPVQIVDFIKSEHKKYLEEYSSIAIDPKKKRKRSSRKRMNQLPRQRQGGMSNYDFYIYEGRKVLIMKERNKYVLPDITSA